MMGTKQKTNGWEDDVLYSRDIYCYTKRPGVSAGIKRQMRRRLRRDAKLQTSDV